MGIGQTFSINTDEIISGVNFSHTNEPMLTFNLSRRLMYVNSVCLKRLPDMDYALIMISSPEKRLSLYPCDSSEHDAVRVRSAGALLNKPRYIRCHNDFLDKLLCLTQWNMDCCYRMIGYIAKNNSESIAAFDLTSAEILGISADAMTSEQLPSSGFGTSFDKHQENPLIKTFDDPTTEKECLRNDYA